LCYCGVFLHWWSEGVFHHRISSALFLRQSNRVRDRFNRFLLWGEL
jgi:hypothetical protein